MTTNIAATAIVSDDTEIGRDVTIGHASIIYVRPIACFTADPAKGFATIDRLVDLSHRLRNPWPRHFRRGYPPESIPALERAADRISELIAADRTSRRARR